MGGRGYVVCLLVGCDDKKLLARLKMSDVSPLGRGRGFMRHMEERLDFLTPLRSSGNSMIVHNHTYGGRLASLAQT
jgi:hypothetical protein